MSRLTQARVVSCAMHTAWKDRFLGVVAKVLDVAKDESKRGGGKTDVREAFTKLLKVNIEVTAATCAYRRPTLQCTPHRALGFGPHVGGTLFTHPGCLA